MTDSKRLFHTLFDHQCDLFFSNKSQSPFLVSYESNVSRLLSTMHQHFPDSASALPAPKISRLMLSKYILSVSTF